MHDFLSYLHLNFQFLEESESVSKGCSEYLYEFSISNDGASKESTRPTNKEALDWYKQNLKNGKVSEEATKSEAVAFFNLSEDKATISKANFKKDIEGFIASHKSFQTRLLRHLLGEKGGSGKNYDIPPSNFRADISDEKER